MIGDPAPPLASVRANARPRPREGYVLEELDGELVVLHPASDAVFFCNATAALVFRLCDGAREVSEIVALLSAAYPDARERIAGDVHAVLSELSAHGAIELS